MTVKLAFDPTVAKEDEDFDNFVLACRVVESGESSASGACIRDQRLLCDGRDADWRLLYFPSIKLLIAVDENDDEFVCVRKWDPSL